MSRRPKQKVNPSFFPFISVLIAIIGVLTFLVLAVTLTALKPPLVIEAEGDEATAESSGGPAELRSVVIVECKDGKAFIANAAKGEAEAALVFDYGREWYKVLEIHKQRKKRDPAAWQGTPFLDFINRMALQRKQRYLLFLIRPSGIAPYNILSYVVNIRNGIRLSEENRERFPSWAADWTLVYVEEDRDVNLR